MTGVTVQHVTYRPPTKAPRTAWAIHLDRVMRDRDLSQTQAFELVYEPLNLSPKSRTAFRPFLVDRVPNEDEAAALGSVFGWPSEEDEAAIPEPEPEVGLAAALMTLATELRALREEREWVRTEAADLRRAREAWERGVIETLKAIGAGQLPATLLDALAPPPLEPSQQ